MDPKKYKTFNNEAGDADDRGVPANKHIQSGVEFTVDEAIEHIGFGKAQIWIAIAIGIVFMVDAIEMLLLSVISPVLTCYWDLNSFQEAFISTSVFIGELMGSFLWGFAADRYGRKPILVISGCLVFYFGLLSTISPDYYWFIILRLFVGFNVGGSAQTYTMVGEMVPRKYRAWSMIFLTFTWGLGCSFCVLCAYLILPSYSWRYLTLAVAFPVIIGLLCMWGVPESPRFLLAAGRRKQAMEALEKIARINGKTLPPGQLVESEEVTGRGSFVDLWVPVYRITSVILLFLWFTAGFNYYGIILINSMILEDPNYCPSKEGMISTDDVDDVCMEYTAEDYLSVFWSTCGEYLSLPINILTIELLGRLRSFALCYFGTFVACLLLFVCWTDAYLTFVLLVARAFAEGAFVLAYVYTAEVYPTVLRGVAVGFYAAVARVGSLTTPFVGQTLFTVSNTGSIVVYAIFGLICTFLALILPIETKGRHLRQVTDENSEAETEES